MLTSPCNVDQITFRFYLVKLRFTGVYIISSPEPKAHCELIVYQSIRRLSVSLSVSQSVCLSTLLNINISETSGPIATKFYLKHHFGGGKAALGFEQDRI